MTTKFQVFFSHKTSDAERVRELKNTLQDLLPQFPIEDVATAVPYTDEWKVAATAILQSCDMLVCIVSEDTHKSEPIDWEIREADRLGKPIMITTLYQRCELPSACHDLGISAIRWDATEVAGQIGEMLTHRVLFLKHDWSAGVPKTAMIVQQYNIMVQSWEALINRRQTVNTVYTTSNSVLLAGVAILLSFTDKIGFSWTAATVTVMAFLGIALSYNWYRTIISYGILSRAKSQIVSAFEKYMPSQPFDAEWRVLEAKRYTSTTSLDSQTARFFILLYCSIFSVASVVTYTQFI